MIEQTILSGELELKAAVIAPEHPQAAVVFVHGMAEHKERYYPFMNYLCELGFACVIYDQRGHGATAQTPDELGYFGKGGVKNLIEDTRTVVQWTREQYPGLKVFLFGHSMGSMVVRSFAKKYDAEIDGLVVCGSPSNNAVAGLGILLTRIIQLFKGDHYRCKKVAQMMFGPHTKKFKSEGVPNAWLSTNKANVQEYNEDPLCGFLFTLNGYRTVMQLIQETYSTNGWAVNAEAIVNIPFGATLTTRAKYPLVKTKDPFAERRMPWWAKCLIVIACLIVIGAILWLFNCLTWLGI